MSNKGSPLAVDELLARAHRMGFREWQRSAAQNDIAHDLNTLLGRIIYVLETGGDEQDRAWAEATLRIIERVAEFEEVLRITI